MAALLVAISHLRALFFVEFAQSAHRGGATRLLYLITGLGHEAVMVFFVLSGFLISSSVFRSVQAGRWSWATYMLNRLTRLYVVLIPALLLCALWDLCGTRLLSNAGVYTGASAYSHMALGVVAHQDTLRVWLGNLFFLQGVRVPTFGSDGPLWSLSYEFWYYALFPLGLLALRPKTSTRARMVCLALALLILALIGKTIALYFLVWLMGTAVSALPSSRLGRSQIFLVASGLAFGASLVLSRLHSSEVRWPTDFLIGLTFSSLVYCLVSSRVVTHAWYDKGARFLSGVSYSLYLVHVPLLVFLSAWIIRRGVLWQPDAKHLAAAVGIGALIMLYTCLIWRFTEARTEEIRRVIAGRWHLNAIPKMHVSVGEDTKEVETVSQ